MCTADHAQLRQAKPQGPASYSSIEMRPALSQLRRGVLEFCVLAMVRDHEELYAFELTRSLGAIEALATSEGTIYPLLARLRREKLVTSVWRESETGPPRRYYKLSPAGRKALERFGADWSEFRDAGATRPATQRRSER